MQNVKPSIIATPQPPPLIEPTFFLDFDAKYIPAESHAALGVIIALSIKLRYDL